MSEANPSTWIFSASGRIVRHACDDLMAGVRLRAVWLSLAAEDLAQAHSRTLLGPAWPLINYLLFTGTLVLILGQNQGPRFPAYVATGLLVWMFLSETMTQSATMFVREESLIKGTTLPVSVYVLRQVSVTAMRSFYALAGAVPVTFIAGAGITPALITVLPAIVLLLLTAPAVTMVFGYLGVLFRDFQFVVSNVIRLLMFVTPVFWVHEGRGGWRGLLYSANPLTHYIEIVRQPVVDGTVPTTSWLVASGVSVVIAALAFVVLGRCGRQIVFLL